MLKRISRFIQKEIFSFVGTIKTITLLKTSKEYINKLDFKQCINMYNFCKIYYESDNIKPSLYILLRNFNSTISKINFVEIYTYFMNNYIKDNPNESIELDLLLDIDIVLEIINKNLLKTNKIELIISSLNILFNQNLNFRNKTNIEKIYFKIIDKKVNRNPDYNKIYITFEEYDTAFNYLLFLIYFKKLIPESISQIAFSSLYNDSNFSKEKINILINEKLGIGNKNIYNEQSNLDSYKLYILIFDELSQYKNIKEFTFASGSYNIDDYFKILKNENKFLNNLTKINLYIKNLNEQENIYTLKNLIQTNHLKNKLKMDIRISIDFYLKLKELLHEELNGNIVGKLDLYYKTRNHITKYFLPNNLKILSLSFFNYLLLFYDYSNLEILHLSELLDQNYDYNIFSNLPNLKELNTYELTFKNENTLNNLFKTLNKYNQELKILDIKYFNINELNDNKINKNINLNVDLELKNLENLSINYYNDSKMKNKKINVLNIDKCEKLKKIKTSYDFQCQNQNVLNNIENIHIQCFESNNDYFLRTILKCKNLKKLYINFLLPFNIKLIKTLYNNIGKIRHLEIDYWFYGENQESFEELDKKEYAKYEKELKKIIKFKKFGWNFFEESYVFNDEYYKEFNNLKYEDKINKLKNFPILETYGIYSLEHDYKFNKLDLDKEKKIFLEYLNYEENLSEHSYYKFKK